MLKSDSLELCQSDCFGLSTPALAFGGAIGLSLGVRLLTGGFNIYDRRPLVLQSGLKLLQEVLRPLEHLDGAEHLCHGLLAIVGAHVVMAPMILSHKAVVIKGAALGLGVRPHLPLQLFAQISDALLEITDPVLRGQLVLAMGLKTKLQATQ